MKIDPHEYDADAYVGRFVAAGLCISGALCLVLVAIGWALHAWWVA